MALGEKLGNARRALKKTTSEIATATRMKVQTVDDIEREDFRRIPAAIYARGFIKLYAEYVGLDPAPLTAEYMARFATPQRKGSLDPSSNSRVQRILQKNQAEDLPEIPSPSGGSDDLFDRAVAAPERGAPEPLRFDPDNRSKKPAALSHTKTGPSALDQLQDALANAGKGAQTMATSGLSILSGGLNNRKVMLGIAATILAVALIAIITALTVNRKPTSTEEGEIHPPQPPATLRLAVEPADPYVN
jgi:hypothetical protein